MTTKVDGKKILEHAAKIDQRIREALHAIATEEEVTMVEVTAALSAMTWQLRDIIAPDLLPQVEIIAAYISATRGIKTYPALGMQA